MYKCYLCSKPLFYRTKKVECKLEGHWECEEHGKVDNVYMAYVAVTSHKDRIIELAKNKGVKIPESILKEIK